MGYEAFNMKEWEIQGGSNESISVWHSLVKDAKDPIPLCLDGIYISG